MGTQIGLLAPTLICCGDPVVCQFDQLAWFGSCWQCGREFTWSEPTSPKPQAGGGTFTFVVTDVTAAGYRYRAEDNGETQDSISF